MSNDLVVGIVAQLEMLMSNRDIGPLIVRSSFSHVSSMAFYTQT